MPTTSRRRRAALAALSSCCVSLLAPAARAQVPRVSTVTTVLGNLLRPVVPVLSCAVRVAGGNSPALPEPEWYANTCPAPVDEEGGGVPPLTTGPVRGCGVATLANCTNPAWLEGLCGREALAVNACAPYYPQMRQSLLDASGAAREVVSPRAGDAALSDPGHMRATHALTSLDARRFAMSVTADPNSFRSQVEALAAAARSNPFTLPFALGLWEADGNAMKSCAEYVHHRFYGSVQPALTVSAYDGDARAAFRALYGDVTQPTSLGTQGVCVNGNANLYSRDLGINLGPMFGGRPVLANAFKARPHGIILGSSDASVIPAEVWQVWNDAPLCSVPGPECPSVVPTWQWHYDESRLLATMDRVGPATSNFGGDTASSGPFYPEVAPTADHPCGGRRTRGYTDEELDYLQGLQLRYVELLRQLRYQSALEFEGVPTQVGWHDAVSNPPIDESTAGLQTQIESSLFPTTLTATLGGPRLHPVLPSRVTASQNIGQELATLLRTARAWGCLRSGPTPCDWSPRLFARTLADRYASAEEAAYHECVRYVENPDDFGAQRPAPTAAQLPPYDPAFAWSSRSPGHPQWRADIDVPLASGAYHWAYQWGGVLGLASSTLPVLMWRTDDSVYSAFAVSSLNVHTVPSCADGTFFTRSRCHDAFVAGGVTRRAAAFIGNAAPELIDASGRVHLPQRRFARHEAIGNSALGVDYTLSSSYGVTGGLASVAPGAAPDASVFGCSATEPGATSPALNASARVGIDADVRLFGSAQPVVHFDLDASMYRLRRASLSVLGAAVYDCGGDDCPGYSFAPPASDVTQTLAQADAWVTVVGVPVHVTLGASGHLGVVAAAGFSAPDCSGGGAPTSGGVRVSFTPSASVHAYASAAADVLLARVGVKGEMNVLTASLPTGVDIGVQQDGCNGRPGPCLRVRAGSDMDLTTLDGRIAVFAEVGVWPLRKRIEREVVSWNGASLHENVFHPDFALSIGDMRQVPWSR